MGKAWEFSPEDENVGDMEEGEMAKKYPCPQSWKNQKIRKVLVFEVFFFPVSKNRGKEVKHPLT